GVLGRGEYLKANTASYLTSSKRDSVCSKSFGFSRKAHNDVAGDADLAPRRLHPRNAFEVLLAGIEALHGLEHAGRAALHRQMHVVAECRNRIYGFNNVSSEISWVRGHEAHPLHIRKFAH